LIERINIGLRRKLTFISAPTGFGKTSLLSEWVAGPGHPVAWFSLAEGYNSPVCFWLYFIAVLQTVVPNIGGEALISLQSPQMSSIVSIPTSLLYEIATIPNDLILVLDDYHAIDSKPIDAALTFLIERLPPRLHLIIVTREDPDLPIARLRTRDQLVELRVKDLRFTESEAAEFLSQVMGLRLIADDIAALETRTKGWIAGL